MNLDQYMDLFVHRSDVYAEQQSDGRYFPVRKSFTEMELEEHLGGYASYGVYVIGPYDEGPMNLPRQTVKYVVFDLDTYDVDALEVLCKMVEKHIVKRDSDVSLLRCLLLEDSGGKGYHIWLFLSEPLPARQVRAWVEPVAAAYREARAHNDWPALEIFPKQDEVPEEGLGNLVKLPLGVHAKTGNRSEFLPVQGWADDVSLVQRLDVGLIPAAPERTDGVNGSSTRTSGSGGPAPFACLSKIIQEGAPEGMRNKALLHLSLYAKGTGLPQELAEEWCLLIRDSFWSDSDVSNIEVLSTVRKAYESSSPHASCSADWLQDFCPGGGSCFAPWNTARTTKRVKVEQEDDYWRKSREERAALRKA